MSMNERIFKIEQLLAVRSVVSFKDLMAELEVSPATLKRDLAYLRDRMQSPIEFDRSLGGYRRAKPTGKAARRAFRDCGSTPPKPPLC